MVYPPLTSLVMSLSSDLEVSNSIFGSAVGFFSRDNYTTVYIDYVFEFNFPLSLFFLVFGGGPCFFVTTVQAWFSNFFRNKYMRSIESSSNKDYFLSCSSQMKVKVQKTK